MDNVNFHRSQLMKSFYDKENIQVLFMPPYSP